MKGCLTMARRRRNLEGNVVYHVYNRRIDKQCLFDSDSSYEEFVALIAQANERYPVRLHSYCLMSTHWHLAVSAERPQFLSNYVGWISTKHAMRVRRDTMTVGQGHIYQGRFQAVPVNGVVHYVTLLRYIEANPLTAGLVTRAEEWRWSSLRTRSEPTSLPIIQPGPWVLPTDWQELVNTPDVRFDQVQELLGQVASFHPEPIVFPW